MTSHPGHGADLLVRALREEDVPAADHVMRVAFGTMLGAAEPARFFGDAAFVWHRLKIAPDAAFAAEIDGQVVGSNLPPSGAASRRLARSPFARTCGIVGSEAG